MQLCQTESRFGDFDAKKEKPDELMLNDKTKVGFTTWDKLKDEACSHDWGLQPWFVSTRSELISPYIQNKMDERAMQVLVQLRSAQKAQGNMDPLKEVRFEVKEQPVKQQDPNF